MDRSTEQVYIYGLCEPGLTVRYVGKTLHPRTRFFAHLHEAIKGQVESRKAQWIATLLRNHQPPVMVILDIVSSNEWRTKEQEWIDKYSANDLVNGASGGNGSETYRKSHYSSPTRVKYKRIHQIGETVCANEIDAWLVIYKEIIKAI